MKTDEPASQQIVIEPFDPARHDRTAFSCGSQRIDNFLKRTAKKHQKGDFTRVWVAVEPGDARVRGFYAINAHALEADALPAQLTKNAPRHGSIPAVYLSTLGVDQSIQGRGLGRVLLADALRRTARAARDLGIACIVLDVLDDTDESVEKRRRFYESFGFASLPSRPMRMILATATIRKALERPA